MPDGVVADAGSCPLHTTPSSLDGNGNPIPTVVWYDRCGNWLGSSATSGYYQAKTTITSVAPNPPTGTARDLMQIIVKVYSVHGRVQ